MFFRVGGGESGENGLPRGGGWEMAWMAGCGGED